MRKCNLGGKEQFVNYSFEVNGHGSPMNYGLLRQFCELPNQPSIAHNFLGNNSNVNDFKPNVSNQGQQGTNSLLMFFDQSKFQFNSTNFNPISNLVFQILISKTKKYNINIKISDWHRMYLQNKCKMSINTIIQNTKWLGYFSQGTKLTAFMF